jgi:hypothetical protein
MSQIKRLWFAIRVTIAMGLTAIFHFRIGVDYLYPMAIDTYSGPFSTYASALESLVPVAISIVLVAAWAYVIFGSVQEEKRRVVRRP